MPSIDDMNQAHARVVARAWSDPAFKDRLVSNPASALAEEGVQLPAGVNVQVHVADANTAHLVIPPAPQGGAPVGGADNTVHCLICF